MKIGAGYVALHPTDMARPPSRRGPFRGRKQALLAKALFLLVGGGYDLGGVSGVEGMGDESPDQKLYTCTPNGYMFIGWLGGHAAKATVDIWKFQVEKVPIFKYLSRNWAPKGPPEHPNGPQRAPKGHPGGPGWLDADGQEGCNEKKTWIMSIINNAL